MSSCNQPSSVENSTPTVVKTPVQDHSSDHKGKNDGRIQSVNVTINNSTIESSSATFYMGLDYDVVPIASGPGTTYDEIALSATSMVINGQTVPVSTSTNVTLPNTHVVAVTWTQSGGNIVIQVQGTGG
jgi:hypothetical protein